MKAHSFTYQLWVTGVKTVECASSCGNPRNGAAVSMAGLYLFCTQWDTGLSG
ncbi:hypothetical protein ACQSDJ_24285 [Salmonella enterica]|uniref:hypothetical protein n=1 Tax=Salmonella enterica TaxID=28901 RepID=UPI003D324158